MVVEREPVTKIVLINSGRCRAVATGDGAIIFIVSDASWSRVGPINNDHPELLYLEMVAISLTAL